MKSISRSEQHIFFNTFTSVVYTTSHWCKSTSRRHAIPPFIPLHDLLWLAGNSADVRHCPVLRHSARFPWNTERQSLKKSLFNWESRRSSLVLLGRERRFARWMLYSTVWNPRYLSFTSEPVFCRFVLPCQILLPSIKTVGSTVQCVHLPQP